MYLPSTGAKIRTNSEEALLFTGPCCSKARAQWRWGTDSQPQIVEGHLDQMLMSTPKWLCIFPASNSKAQGLSYGVEVLTPPKVPLVRSPMALKLVLPEPGLCLGGLGFRVFRFWFGLQQKLPGALQARGERNRRINSGICKG